MEYINNEQNEINSNKYSVKCILVTVLILYITWVLNLLNVFSYPNIIKAIRFIKILC